MSRPWAVVAGFVTGGIAAPVAAASLAGTGAVRPALLAGVAVAAVAAVTFGTKRTTSSRGQVAPTAPSRSTLDRSRISAGRDQTNYDARVTHR